MRLRFLLLTVLFFSFAGSALAAEKLRVDEIRFGVTGNNARIVLETNKKPDYKAFLQGDPYRLVVDLPPADLKVFKSRFVNNNIVKSYHTGILDDGMRRVIFDLRKPAIIEAAFTIAKDSMNRDRLVIDLKPASENLFRARAEEITGNKELKGDGSDKPPMGAGFKAKQNEPVKAVLAPVVAPVKKPARKYTVVVDPGHGGDDPGAVGDGVKEKHITLAVARELKRQLEETGRYKVVLTRERDHYVKLYRRVDISREVGGDLFISIHADKIGRNNIRGASIYTLSETASDAETERLAEGENNAGFVAGVDLSQESKDVSDILLDLAMREKMNESNMFARMLSYALKKHDVKLLPNSHRSAGFAVLKAPDVPSVLIETGFLSNPDEAKLLSSSQFQANIADAIVDGVDDYFRKIQALQKR